MSTVNTITLSSNTIKAMPKPYVPMPRTLCDAGAQRLNGCKVEFEDYRFGTMTINAVWNGPVLTTVTYWFVMSEETWAALCRAETIGGTTWEKALDAIDPEYTALFTEANGAKDVKSRMVDVPVRRARPAPQAGSRSADRIGALCVGIQKLVAEMTPHCDGREVSEDRLAAFASKYGHLRTEMAALRDAFSEAEGQFEIAQAQMVHLMEDR